MIDHQYTGHTLVLSGSVLPSMKVVQAEDVRAGDLVWGWLHTNRKNYDIELESIELLEDPKVQEKQPGGPALTIPVQGRMVETERIIRIAGWPFLPDWPILIQKLD